MIAEDEQSNYEIFRDCLSDALIQHMSVHEPKANVKKSKSSKTRRRSELVKKARDGVDSSREQTGTLGDAAELGEFIEYLASEIFPSLPEELRTFSYSAVQNSTALASRYSVPLSPTTTDTLLNHIPPSATDSLSTYLTLDIPTLLLPPLVSYISTTTAPPPLYSTTRTTHCELCLRSWIPLTYHHLIPRSTHAKVLKRGWHEEWELNKVAWLCRACHSFVHRCASNEELAREWDSVEKLAGREDVRAFVGWVGRVRWKSR